MTPKRPKKDQKAFPSFRSFKLFRFLQSLLYPPPSKIQEEQVKYFFVLNSFQLHAGAQAGAGTSQAEQVPQPPQGMRGAKTLRKKPLNGAQGSAQGVHPTATSEQTGAGAQGAQTGAGAQGAQTGAGAQTVQGAGAHSPQGAQAGRENSSRKKPLKGVQICFAQGPQLSQTGAGAAHPQSCANVIPQKQSVNSAAAIQPKRFIVKTSKG